MHHIYTLPAGAREQCEPLTNEPTGHGMLDVGLDVGWELGQTSQLVDAMPAVEDCDGQGVQEELPPGENEFIGQA